jgi:inward rectifier potassium channel
MRQRAGTKTPRRTRRQPPPGLRRAPPAAGSAPQAAWFIARGKADETLAVGLKRPWLGDPYYLALRLPWWLFLLSGAGLYLAANGIFALFYLAQPGAIANARPGSFADAFFFSVQTMSTVGYGGMIPATTWANLVVTAESMVGLMFVALATGLVFARFSRPTARVLFSRVAVIAPHNGAPTLSLRLANQRRNQILEAQVDVALLRDEVTIEGETIRRLHDLKLARRRSPSFAMTFTVTHTIDRDSPLHGATAASLTAENAELVVTVSGVDDTISARVYARTSYLADEILWGHRFVDVIGWTEDGRRAIDYRRFHDTIPPTADAESR